VTTASTASAARAARVEAGVQGTAPAEFRRRLLEGMAAAIRETGYREATVADVVRHARTSRRTFYEHFPGKQACFIDLLREANASMVRQIGAAVDRRARWDVQVRQAIEAWIAVAQSDLALTLSWIRDLPSLGADARHLQREWLEAFIVLVTELTDTPELRAAGVGQGSPPSRQLMIMMLGGLRELIATTVEDGGDIGGITEVAARATQAMLDPHARPPPARATS
jgi:AcrR family transcriptional regulator